MSPRSAESRPRRGVLLDRDGTLVDFVRDADLGVVTPAFHPRQLRLLPGVIAGLCRLQAAGFALAIATNQPGAAKGELPREAIARTNAALLDLLAGHGIVVAALEVCLHHPRGGASGDASLVTPCNCRKPAAGMLERIVGRLGLDRAGSFMIGDSAVDLAAARAAGLRPALLMQPGRCELCPLREPATPSTPDGHASAPPLAAARFDDLADLVIGA